VPLTHQQIAERLGVSRSSVSYYASLGCPVAGPFAAIRKWHANFTATAKRATAAPVDAEAAKLEARVRVRRLAIEIAERKATLDLRRLQLDKASGKVVDLAESTRIFNDWTSAARQLILDLPVAAAPNLVGLKDETAAEAVLGKLVDALLEQLQAIAQEVPEDGKEVKAPGPGKAGVGGRGAVAPGRRSAGVARASGKDSKRRRSKRPKHRPITRGRSPGEAGEPGAPI